MLTLFYDFVPIFIFLIAFKLNGIYTATRVGIIATAIQCLLTLIWTRRWDQKQIITFAIFTLFGGMTLYFHNPIFIKWKPTVLFWVFSTAFLMSSFLFGRIPLIKRLMGPLMEKEVSIPLNIWSNLNSVWALFFLILGCVNLWVAYHCSTNTWVNFKVYGIMILMLVFSLGQAFYLASFSTKHKEF